MADTFCVVCDQAMPQADAEALRFCCDECQTALNDCPECQSDDVEFDWRITFDDNDKPIFQWLVECNMCEWSFVGDEDSAKEVYHSWQIEPRGAVQND